MSVSEKKQGQPGLLEEIQDEIVYIIECLVEDYTGEAKSSITEIIDKINEMTGLDSGYREALVVPFRNIYNELISNNQSGSARSGLTTLRRKVTNTRLQLLGRSLKYNYADIFVATDE